MQKKRLAPWRELPGDYLQGNNERVLLNSLRRETVAIEELVTWFESHCEDLTGSAAVASHLGPGPVKM